MNIDTQIVYIVILLFTCLVLLCISLTYLYISILNKYTKVKDDPIINNAKKIADKIVDSTQDFDNKYDQIMERFISEISAKWEKEANQILNKNIKILDDDLKKSVSDKYEKQTSDLLLYKQEKIKEFDELVGEYVAKVGKEIIRREIDVNDHKRLVEEGLERAKKVGLFK